MTSYEQEWTIGWQAVTEAARFAESVRAAADVRDHKVKADESPVTIADFGVQAIIHRRLAEAFPGDPIVAEEDTSELSGASGPVLLDRLVEALGARDRSWTREAILHQVGLGGHDGGAAGRFWTLDPIDGTKGFIRGDQYAIALSLIEDGRPVLGILGCPHFLADGAGPDEPRGWIFAASMRHGPVGRRLADGREGSLRVADIAAPDEIRMCESFEHKHSDHGISASIGRTLGLHRAAVRMDSQAKYAAVSSGMADVYLRLPTKGDYREKIWDHAAGVFILERAGGTVTDVAGRPLDFSRGRTLAMNRGIVAAASGVHPQVLRAVMPHFT